MNNRNITVSPYVDLNQGYHNVLFQEDSNKLLLQFHHHSSYPKELQQKAKAAVGDIIMHFLTYSWYDLISVLSAYRELDDRIKQFVPPSPEINFDGKAE